jgi:hypothetical protein
MKTLTFIKSSDTEALKWNETTKRYELKLEFVKQEMDVNFADDGVTEKRIKKNSKKIYNYIYYHSYGANKPFIERLLNETKQGQEFLKDVLLEQFEADNETAFNDLSSQPAVNIANGQIIDRDELQRNQISVDTEQIIERNADYFGFNICVMTKFPPALILFLMRG